MVMSSMSSVGYFYRIKMTKYFIIFITTVLLQLPFLSGKAQTVQEIVNNIRMGKFEEAKASLLKIEHTDQKTVLFLKGLLETDGKSAEQYYTEIVNNHPDSKYFNNALYRLALLKYTSGLYKTATDYFQKIVSSTSNDYLKQKCSYWLGLCYQATDQENLARLKFSEVINQYPETEFSDMARINLNNFNIPADSTPPEFVSESKLLYAVQVGAFLNQQNAILRKAFYENHNYRVELHTKFIDDKKFYLVWIGPYDSMSQARSIGESLKKKFDQRYTLVTREE